jgi:hypothetical protein
VWFEKKWRLMSSWSHVSARRVAHRLEARKVSRRGA